MESLSYFADPSMIFFIITMLDCLTSIFIDVGLPS